MPFKYVATIFLKIKFCIEICLNSKSFQVTKKSKSSCTIFEISLLLCSIAYYKKINIASYKKIALL